MCVSGDCLTGRELSCGEDTNLFVDEAVCSSELFRCASRRNNQSEARGPFRRREASAEQLFSRPLYRGQYLAVSIAPRGRKAKMAGIGRTAFETDRRPGKYADGRLVLNSATAETENGRSRRRRPTA